MTGKGVIKKASEGSSEKKVLRKKKYDVRSGSL